MCTLSPLNIGEKKLWGPREHVLSLALGVPSILKLGRSSMGLGGGCQVGRSVSKGPEGGLDHLRFLPVGSVGGSGDQAQNKPDTGLGEIITKPLEAIV